MLLQDYAGTTGGSAAVNTKVSFSYAGFSQYATLSIPHGIAAVNFCTANGMSRSTTMNVIVTTESK
jgi:hypothetical protein